MLLCVKKVEIQNKRKKSAECGVLTCLSGGIKVMVVKIALRVTRGGIDAMHMCLAELACCWNLEGSVFTRLLQRTVCGDLMLL